MHIHGRVLLDAPVRLATLLQSSRVHEIAGCDGLLDRGQISTAQARFRHKFHSFAQVNELITHVANTAERLRLSKVVQAKYLAVSALHPLIPDVQQREMIATRTYEQLTSTICMHLFVLGPEE